MVGPIKRLLLVDNTQYVYIIPTNRGIIVGKGKFARDKGKRGERQTAEDLRIAFPMYAEEVKRGWQSREGDDDPDVCGIPGLWCECKSTERAQPRAALEQAEEDSKGRGMPLAVIRQNHKKPYAVVYWSDMIKMLQVYVAFMEEHKNDAKSAG